jgi:hypothetical protein
MSELHEPITELAPGLQIPEPRELPHEAREAQLALLMKRISEERGILAPSRARRLFTQLRALAMRLGLLSLLVGACVLGSVAANGNNRVAKGAQVTAVTAVATTLALAVARTERVTAQLPALRRVQIAPAVLSRPTF